LNDFGLFRLFFFLFPREVYGVVGMLGPPPKDVLLRDLRGVKSARGSFERPMIYAS